MVKPLSKDRDILRRVRLLLERHARVKANELLLVGVSGGPDSVCLLHLLTRLTPQFGVRLWAAHLDHGLRGAEGAADAAFVRALCERLGVPCTMERGDVAEYQRTHHGVSSVEEAAREVRYSFFTHVAYQTGAAAVAVGHTADDQVETVLLHLLRGTGVAGLGGMAVERWWNDPPSGRPLRILRPLLEVRREETEAYCRGHRLEFRIDSSNLTAAYARNRIRQEVLPQLRSVNPQADQAILRVARLAREEEAYWTGEVARVWPQVADVWPEEVLLDIPSMLLLPSPLQKRVLRHAYAQLSHGPRGIESTHAEALVRLLASGSGKVAALSHGIEAAVEGSSLVFRRRPRDASLSPPSPPLLLLIPGDTEWDGWRVQTHLASGALLPSNRDPWCAHLDYDRTGPQLWVRSRQPGDRFQPLGMAHRKKLQDLLVDTRIPRRLRDSIPLIVTGEAVLWVGSQRIGERYKVTPETTTTLTISLVPLQENAGRLLRFCDSIHYNNTPADVS